MVSLTGARRAWREVAEAHVACGVPAARWPCPGGSGSCRASTDAEGRASGGGERWGDVTRWRVQGVLARVHADPGMRWACLGASVLACVCVALTRGGHGRVQGGEREVKDKVMQAGLDQKRRWHEVACHATAWHGLGCLIQTKSSASGEVDVVK
jgi:hypothetical protein